jgi:hypothetical protein
MSSRATRARHKSPPAPSDASVSLTPLAYMLAVINDPAADPDRRDRMAICAAQYCHPRAANHPKGKKAIAREAAAEAGAADGWGDDLGWQQ